MCVAWWIAVILAVSWINYTDSSNEDNFEGRLNQLPQRLSAIGQVFWPDGVPTWFMEIYAPIHSQPSLCRNHSLIYTEFLSNYTTWALQMFDSSTKLPSGLLKAHFKDLGSYDECLEVDQIGPFPVQHCLLELRGFMKYPKLPVNLDKVETIVGGIPVLKPNLGLSLCLPLSCNQDNLLHHYNKVFNHLNLTPILDRYSCSSNEKSKMATADWIGFVCVPISLLPVLSKVFEKLFLKRLKLKGSTIWKIINCFSAKRNSSTILEWKDPRRPLAVLRGLRYIAISWIVLAHNYAIVVATPTLNWIDIYDLMESWGGAVFQNGKCAVDLFLMMGGLLLSYLFMDSMKHGRKFNLGLFYLHRLVRILPTYAAVVLLGMTFYPKFRSGPLWKNTIERHKDNCLDHWWTNFLFINNYVHTDRQCLPHAWYLAVDMQLHLLSPIILFPLYKWKKFGKIVLPLLIFSSVIISFCVSYFNEIPAGAVIARDLTTIEAYATEYITTHTRFGAWLIGVGLGYLLHQFKKTNTTLSRKTVFISWCVSLVFSLSTLLGISYFIRQENVYNRLESAFYTGLQSVLWSLGMAWMIFACETGYAGPIRSFLASKLFQPLGKLTFSIYLIHGSIQYLLLGTMKTPHYVDTIANLIGFSGVMTVTVVTSYLFCMIFELPFINLEKIILGTEMRYVFQQDRAAHYFANPVKLLLNNHFQDRWIGHRSEFLYRQLRSPDLTVCDFFL
ncbi:nose resistant to fluoxetine protein 6-like [Lycorma delicatula]|uniref:nose resistant to fluoxetine protein 6-like n=1 Tax=Lycorma delicatula TaxID=130591 RepID=UPI003F512A46